MYDFFAATAWKMTPFPAYGFTHLSIFFCGLFLSVLAAIKLRNISVKKLDKILFFIGLFLLVTEIYKQLFHIYVLEPVGTYKYWIFPFYLCSVPMYFFLLLPFVRKEGIKRGMYAFLTSYNFIGGFMAFIEPSGIIHDYVTLTIHSFTWHMLIVFAGLLIGANANLRFTMKDFRRSMLCYVLLALLAIIINILMYDVSGGSVNAMFIGPPITSLIVFRDIAEKYGWAVNAVVFSAVLTLGAFLAFLPIMKLKKPYRIREKK